MGEGHKRRSGSERSRRCKILFVEGLSLAEDQVLRLRQLRFWLAPLLTRDVSDLLHDLESGEALTRIS